MSAEKDANSFYESLDGKVMWRIVSRGEDRPADYFIDCIDGHKVKNNDVLSPVYIIRSKIHKRSACYYSGKIFPDEFIYCPECGALLLSNKNKEDEGVLWIPPYGSVDGLKLWSINKNIKTDTQGELFLLPSDNGIFAFCYIRLGCENRVLMAIQKNTGRLWVYDREKEAWVQIEGTIGKIINFPVWSWSAAVTKNETFLCVPCDDSVDIVKIDWISNSAMITRQHKCPVGGAVGYDEYFIVPVSGDGVVGIKVYDSLVGNWFDAKWSGKNESVESMVVLSDYSEKKKIEYTGIPVIDKWNECIYWSCYRGYIKVTLQRDKRMVVCEYVPWEKDRYPATALLQNGPPYLSDGGREILWQLCHDQVPDSHRDCTVYKLFRLGAPSEGVEDEDWKYLKCGQILSTGHACFSTTENYWNQIGIKDANAHIQRDIRVPLLEFSKTGMVLLIKILTWQDRKEFEDFTEIFGRNNSVGQICFVIEGSGIPEQPLIVDEHPGNEFHGGASIFSYEMSKIQEIVAFISGNALNIYLPEIKRCYTWKIYYE